MYVRILSILCLSPTRQVEFIGWYNLNKKHGDQSLKNTYGKIC